MSSNIIGPFPKKSVAPSEKFAPSEEVKNDVELWIILKIQWSQSIKGVWIIK